MLTSKDFVLQPLCLGDTERLRGVAPSALRWAGAAAAAGTRGEKVSLALLSSFIAVKFFC